MRRGPIKHLAEQLVITEQKMHLLLFCKSFCRWFGRVSKLLYRFRGIWRLLRLLGIIGGDI